VTARSNRATLASVWEEFVWPQHGVVTRGQALASGVTLGAIRRRLQAGKWRRLYPGVYVTFTGPVPRSALLWAAVLRAGPGAMLSHETAAELAGLLDQATDVVHVTIPTTRRAQWGPGLRCHLSVRALVAMHPTRQPPQTRIEETVVDLTQTARGVNQALAWVTRACARRLTTVERLRAAFGARKRLRWRRELTAALDDIGSGCHSTLELEYLRRVERPHGLPVARRQMARSRRGGRWYDDVRYEAYGVLVELDGPAYHPEETTSRDKRRDNAAVADGWDVLRYGVDDIAGQPCTVAREVAVVLRRNGWSGQPRRCGPGCDA
jgi:very-short-patch-repair endonuclease